MKRPKSSRREFLRNGSAALTIGCTLKPFGDWAFAAPPAGNQVPSSFNQAIACSRREAAEAAREVLQQGGNAIDAAVAALLVLFVVEPSKVGLGGYGGSLVVYRAQSNRVHAIDSDSRAPRKFDSATFNEAAATHGYLAVGVPGNVAGLDLALREHGTLPFKTLAKHSVSLAENGVIVTPQMAASFNSLQKNLDPASRRAYFPNGVPAAGAPWIQADLARLIRRLGEEGPACFYNSDIAATISKQVQAGGGVLAVKDFHDFHATVVEPLQINYRGYVLYTPPLPSGGLTSLSILKTLEQFDLSKLTPWGAQYIELFTGASNLAWEERFQYFGDPDFVKVPVAELLSEKRAVERAEKLRRGMTSVKPQPAEESHTVNVVICDKDQNLVSWTATHGADYGAQVAIEGLGLMLGHGMSRFAFNSPDPNYPVGGKRPQHNMSPLLALSGGKPYAGLGLPGGRRIVTVTAQLAVSLIDFKGTPKQVVSAPRIHTEGAEPIQVTADLPRNVVEELRRDGHRVDIQATLGADANAVVVDPKTRHVAAAASGRSTGVLVF